MGGWILWPYVFEHEDSCFNIMRIDAFEHEDRCFVCMRIVALIS